MKNNPSLSRHAVAELVKRRDQIDFAVTSGAIQRSSLTLGELRGHVPGQGIKPGHRVLIQGGTLLSRKAIVRQGRGTKAVAGRNLVALFKMAPEKGVQ